MGARRGTLLASFAAFRSLARLMVGNSASGIFHSLLSWSSVMKMSRVFGCVALVLVVATIASAQNQGRRGGGLFGGRGGLGQSLVGLAAQESVQKDLGLSADNV